MGYGTWDMESDNQCYTGEVSLPPDCSEGAPAGTRFKAGRRPAEEALVTIRYLCYLILIYLSISIYTIFKLTDNKQKLKNNEIS